MKQQKMKKQQGITLIALIITIIILLILAGITIGSLTGKDGIIKKAIEAGNNYQIAAQEEENKLNDLSQETDRIIMEIEDKKLEWEFEFTGSEQTLILPYKGNYKIEAYGAQGGTASEEVIGGNGTYIKGNVILEKNAKISIYVGGQEGYNGGGQGSEVQGNGGGASDIRLNGNDITNRILVAGGGGGSIAEIIYHKHTGSSSSGGGCYTKPYYTYRTYNNGCDCTRPTTHPSNSNWCGRCGHDWTGGHKNGSRCGANAGWYNGSGYSVPSGASNVTISRYDLGCGKTDGQFEGNNYMNGNIESSSNDTAYQGSEGGGGGYYGGQTQYAGTSYTREDFTQVETTKGAREGNGYVKITLLQSYPDK